MASKVHPALVATGPNTSLIISRRSSAENSGFFPGWIPMATTSRSHRPTACRPTARWPLVTGWNEQGYSAIRGINPSTPPRAAPQAGPVPVFGPPGLVFIFRRPLNQFGGQRVSSASRLCFVRNGRRNKTQAGRNHFCIWRRYPETGAAYQITNETTGQRPNDRGPSMIKALSAVAIAAFVAAALTVLPGFAPQVEASVPHALAKGDRLDIPTAGAGG